MYQVLIKRLIKKLDSNQIQITSYNKLNIFESTDYEETLKAYNTHLKSELEFISLIDFQVIHTIIELYSCDVENGTHTINKIITLQNF